MAHSFRLNIITVIVIINPMRLFLPIQLVGERTSTLMTLFISEEKFILLPQNLDIS